MSAEALFAWHEREGALERLTPPWETVSVVKSDRSLKPGSEVHLRLQKGPLSLLWIAEHTEYDPPHLFVDVQKKGPFTQWIHRHEIRAEGETSSTLSDSVTYASPFAPFLRRGIDRMFTYRHALLQNDLKAQNAMPAAPMRIGMTGSRGFVGRNLAAFLTTAGHTVVPIRRGGGAFWETGELEGLDVVVHLAGENIAGRWTAKKKEAILQSRVEGTRALVKALEVLADPPKVLVSASAVGIYDEGFLSEVCQAWEAEAARYTKGRVVNPRIGLVLSPSGGMLAKILPLFRFGLGGVVGPGDQWHSWIALDDLIYGIYRLIVDERFSGAVDLTAPHPVTQKELVSALAKAVHRPALCPVPTPLARLAFGEMGEATILASCRREPKELQEAGHTFAFPELSQALSFFL